MNFNTVKFGVTFTAKADAFIHVPNDVDLMDQDALKKYILEHWNCVGFPEVEGIEIVPNSQKFDEDTSVEFVASWNEADMEPDIPDDEFDEAD